MNEHGRHKADHARTLRGLACLAEVSDRAIAWLAGHVEPHAFPPGTTLIRQGDPTRECYFITEGETEVRRDGVVLGISGPGEPEGELGLFLHTPRSATTTALTSVTTLALGPRAWDRLCQEDATLANEIRVCVCRHLARRFGLSGFAGVSLED